MPFLARRGYRESRIWGCVLDRVVRRPLLSAIVSGGALLALALPAIQLHTQLPSFTDLPKSIGIVRTYEAIQKAFPGAQTPAQVVVRAGDVTAPQVQRGIAALKRQALATGEMSTPIETKVNPAKTVEVVSIPLQGNGDNGASVAALQTLRRDVIPATIGAVPGVVAP